MSNQKMIAVAGATGSQGGGLLRAILDDNLLKGLLLRSGARAHQDERD
jgi:uncharacterized protein YbjT (DUF2867 family)